MRSYTRFPVGIKLRVGRLWMNTRVWMNTVRGGSGVGTGGDGESMTTWTRAELGAFGEQLAVEHLTSQGLRVLARNWRCRYGELDVIAADDATRTVVFVEVKTRTGERFGGAVAAVTADKVRRLRRLAGIWLAQQQGGWAGVRIDVIAVRIGRRATPEITQLRGVGG